MFCAKRLLPIKLPFIKSKQQNLEDAYSSRSNSVRFKRCLVANKFLIDMIRNKENKFIQTSESGYVEGPCSIPGWLFSLNLIFNQNSAHAFIFNYVNMTFFCFF